LVATCYAVRVTPHLSATLFCFFTLRPPPRSPLFPYTTLFRSQGAPARHAAALHVVHGRHHLPHVPGDRRDRRLPHVLLPADGGRSEEHTSELQSRVDLVCRLLLEKKKIRIVHTKYLTINRSRS